MKISVVVKVSTFSIELIFTNFSAIKSKFTKDLQGVMNREDVFNTLFVPFSNQKNESLFAVLKFRKVPKIFKLYLAKKWILKDGSLNIF